MQNQPGSDLALADCVRFGPNGSGPEASPVCNNHPARLWPMLPSRSGPDANGIRHVYWGYLTSNAIGILGKPRLLPICNVFDLINRDHTSNTTKNIV